MLIAINTFAEWSNPVKVEELSSLGEDYYLCLSLDGQWMYFTSIRGGYGDDDIYVSHWETDHWGPPSNLGPVINDDQRNLSPSISPDGDTLYFVSYGQPGGIGSYDIWKSWKIPGGWAEPVNLGPNVNTPGAEWTVYIAPDNNHLYISSNSWGSIGFMNIFVCARTDSGWTSPEPLTNINNYHFTYGTTMTADMQTLYYSENRYSASELDIFKSTWQNNQWCSGEWLPSPINCEVSDHCPTISADGLTMYFASRRDTNTSDNDIYITHWTSGVEKYEEPILCNFSMIKSYPNPANGEVTIEYTVEKRTEILNISIYDILCRLVYSDSVNTSAGVNTYKWKGANQNQNSIPSGVYFAVLQNGDTKSNLIKILLIK